MKPKSEWIVESEDSKKHRKRSKKSQKGSREKLKPNNLFLFGGPQTLIEKIEEKKRDSIKSNKIVPANSNKSSKKTLGDKKSSEKKKKRSKTMKPGSAKQQKRQKNSPISRKEKVLRDLDKSDPLSLAIEDINFDSEEYGKPKDRRKKVEEKKNYHGWNE
jgi:hypothetical protein